jgi:sulfate adenylyltransferase subunit 2
MTVTHADYQLSQLDQLEAESIHIFREVAAEFEKPVLMFSGGKDSIVMMRLAEKAFYPPKIPFPVLQVDTGYDFPEVLETRDNWVNRLGVRLIVACVEEAIANGVVVDDGKTSRNRCRPARCSRHRGERLHRRLRRWPPRRGEGARQGARLLAPRRVRQWDPKMQRPELWSLYNGRSTRASTCGSSRSPTGPSWTSGTTSAARRSRSLIYFSHSAACFRARRHAAQSESEHNPLRAPARPVRGGTSPVPHRRRPSRSTAAASPEAAHHRRDHRRRSPSPAIPELGPPGATTGSPKQPWRTGRRKGYF